MEKTPSRLFLTLAILGGILAISTASIFIRFASAEAPSLVIAAMRLTIASLVLAPIALTHHKVEIKSLTKSEWIPGLISGIFLALHFATWISSLEYTSVVSSVVIVQTTPLWVALLSPIFLKTKITRTIFMGIIIALLGGIIIGLSDACSWSSNGLSCPPFSTFVQGDAFFGDLLALCGALAAAGYVMIGQHLRTKMTLIPYIFVVYSMSAFVLIAIMLGAHQSPFGFSTTTYVWLIALALIPQLLGHSTFNWALAHLPAALVSLNLLGEPIGTTILAFIILGEAPSPAKLFGGALILLGIYVSSKSDSG